MFIYLGQDVPGSPQRPRPHRRGLMLIIMFILIRITFVNVIHMNIRITPNIFAN